MTNYPNSYGWQQAMPYGYHCTTRHFRHYGDGWRGLVIEPSARACRAGALVRWQLTPPGSLTPACAGTAESARDAGDACDARHLEVRHD